MSCQINRTMEGYRFRRGIDGAWFTHIEGYAYRFKRSSDGQRWVITRMVGPGMVSLILGSSTTIREAVVRIKELS